MNRIYLKGICATEVKHGVGGGGSAWANFRISVSKKVKDKWESQFFSVVGFGKTAEEIQKIRKGFRIFLDGELQVREYEKDGVKKEQYQIVAYNLLFQPKHNEGTAGPNDFSPEFDNEGGDDFF